MAHAIFRSPLMIQEYARNIKKMEHNIGPCPHCTEIGLNLKFISKERFKKHHDLEHSTLALLSGGCNCSLNNEDKLDTFYSDVKEEIAMKEQITVENTAGDVIQFDFYNFKSEVGAVLGNDNSSGAYLDNCFTGENPQGISKTDALEIETNLQESEDICLLKGDEQNATASDSSSTVHSVERMS